MKKYLFMFGIMVTGFLLLTVGVNAKEYKKYTIGEEIRFNPVTGEYCNSGDECYTFNVINTDKYNDYIEMMLNFNLIESVNLNNSDYLYIPSILRGLLAEETRNWKGVEKYSADNQLDHFFLDIGTQKNGNVVYDHGYDMVFNNNNARLITVQELATIANFNGDFPISSQEKFYIKDNLGLSSNLFTSSASYLTVTPFGILSDDEKITRYWIFNGNEKCLEAREISSINNSNIGLRPVVKIKKIEKTEDDSKIEITTSEKIESTSKQEKNPSTSDSILSIITIMILISSSSFIILKKVRNN